MTYEEVKRIRENPTWEDVDSKELQEMIDKAVEKQIPKKVIREDIEVAELDYCPNCKVRFFTKYGMAYCSSCGQALDWSDKK